MPIDPEATEIMGEGTPSYMVTFDNQDGATVGQTDLLDYRPSASLVGNILATQPPGPVESVASSATVTYIVVGEDHSIIYSEVVTVVWSTR